MDYKINKELDKIERLGKTLIEKNIKLNLLHLFKIGKQGDIGGYRREFNLIADVSCCSDEWFLGRGIDEVVRCTGDIIIYFFV